VCCFSRPVQQVSKTRIFARAAAGGREGLAYAMSFAASEDLAMILPLPVPPGAADDAVRFIDLHDYPFFFDDLDRGFPEDVDFLSQGVRSASATRGPTLVVHAVGAFEASFVPSVDDFDRLDERFRLPRAVWTALPQYADWGFAVFKLKGGGGAGGIRGLFRGAPEQKVHPMAFEFPRRDPRRLFFPTVHIHDGRVHAKARFDHVLYCQADAASEGALADWERSRGNAEAFVRIEKTAGLLEAGRPCFRWSLEGKRANEDIYVEGGAAREAAAAAR
jgi:hypothetical protein